MKVGILSDTHNDRGAATRALQVFRQRGIRTLFHCGDLTAAEMVELIDGFEVYFVRGNMDRHQKKTLKAAIKAQPEAHWLGKGAEVELDGRRIAITHGDREKIVESLLSAEPDYLLMGHTHRRRDERIGSTRVINPGSLGGIQHEARSICILDLARDQLEVIRV